MANDYSVDELLGFLSHASERGLLPAATASALAVACRNVFGVLTDHEKADVRALDLADVIKRFSNKRAKEFNPSSLTEYGRRVQRAVGLFVDWRDNPATFNVKTRKPKGATKKERTTSHSDGLDSAARVEPLGGLGLPARADDSYQTSIPVRPGQVVTISNIPNNLTAAEAERLAGFVKMLGVD